MEQQKAYSSGVSMADLPKSVQEFVSEKAKLCQPDSVYVCDGSPEENTWLLSVLQKTNWIQKLDHMNNW